MPVMVSVPQPGIRSRWPIRQGWCRASELLSELLMTTSLRCAGQLPRICSCAQTPLRHTSGIVAFRWMSSALVSSASVGGANRRPAFARPPRSLPSSPRTRASNGFISLFTAPVTLASKPLPR